MKYFFIIFALFFSCLKKNNDNNPKTDKIKSISISNYGGEMGYSKSLKITSDSLYFNFNLAVDSTKRKHEKKLNNNYKLEDILSTTQLISFSKIKNGKSRLPVDGTDTEIIIETEQNKYSVINAQSNGIWIKVENTINEILNKEFGIE